MADSCREIGHQRKGKVCTGCLFVELPPPLTMWLCGGRECCWSWRAFCRELGCDSVRAIPTKGIFVFTHIHCAVSQKPVTTQEHNSVWNWMWVWVWVCLCLHTQIYDMQSYISTCHYNESLKVQRLEENLFESLKFDQIKKTNHGEYCLNAADSWWG